MEVIAGPAIERRGERAYLSIREVTPFRGMLSARDKLWTELFARLDARKISGPAFLRLNVVDMKGLMDIEAGVVTDGKAYGDARIRAGTLPAGDYATMSYRDHAIRANRFLIDWTAQQGRQFDKREEPGGDRFACRYELNISDPRTERRRTQWIVQLNFLLRPDQGASAQGVRHG